jgi:hydroxymethylglutaryl-CoA lyase
MAERRPVVLISEVGLRYGLQSMAQGMPTELKKRWLTALHAAGLRKIEVASFLPARLMHQLADAAEIVAHALTMPELTAAALVPNLKEVPAALSSGVHKIVIPCSASEGHGQVKILKTRSKMVEELQAITTMRNDLSPNTRVEAVVGVAFGCALQGPVHEDYVISLLEALMEAGADSASLADTAGMANPTQVRRLYRRAISAIGFSNLGAAHMHNTRGLGLANCLAAFFEGIRSFDSSLAGLGEYPHALGASSNVVTEDLVLMFEGMGFDTGIDLSKLLDSRDTLKHGLP